MPIEVTPDAARQLVKIAEHVERIKEHRHAYPDAYRATADSWIRAQGQLWSLVGEGDGGKLWGSGDYSLTLVTSYGMTVGVVWFRDRSFDNAILDAKDHWTGQFCATHRAPLPFEKLCSVRADDTKCFATAVPIPGTWSLHS